MPIDQTPRCPWPAQAVLGEGPLWSPRDACLYWVDVLGRRLHRFEPATGARRSIEAPSEIGCVVERASGGLAVMLRHGLAFVDFDSGAFQPAQHLEGDLAHNRFNDGKVDARGRLWAGTMDFDADKPTGSLYRIGSAEDVTRMDGPYLCPNGPAWSVDGRTLYHAETMERLIFAFAFDVESGTLGERRVFARIPEDEGYPDGMTVDAEDHLWVAHWGGARLTRFRPDGRPERIVPMPVPFVTSCAFGGLDLADLYVTTATLPMSAAETAAAPLAGGLFVLRPGPRGLPSPAFAG